MNTARNFESYKSDNTTYSRKQDHATQTIIRARSCKRLSSRQDHVT